MEKPFALFVYGTLKCGFGNHDRFCRGVLSIEEASVCGALYDLPFGFPALVVPEDFVWTLGTGDPVQDAATQRNLDEPNVPLPTDRPRAFGELLTFDDPEARVPGLDHLEGFDPEGGSLYRRVLVPVETDARTLLAWTYAIERPTGTHLPGGHWPA